jgi:hypothetical protein
MDPVSIIVTAVVLGAAAGLQATAEQVVKDAYAGLKALIQRKYAGVDLAAVEKKPESTAKQESLAEDLAEAGAGEDNELLEQAERVVASAQESAQATALAAELKIKLDEVRAGFLKLKSGRASGAIDIQVGKSELPGGIDLGDLQAGVRPN